MRYIYPARFEQQPDGEVVVSFVDIPEALTSGSDMAEAWREASDALGAALAGYVIHGLPIPEPTGCGPGLVAVSPPPLLVAKLALRDRMRELGLTNVALAKRLGVSETAVRRLVDPDHASRLDRVAAALTELGQHLVIDVDEHAPAGSAA